MDKLTRFAHDRKDHTVSFIETFELRGDLVAV